MSRDAVVSSFISSVFADIVEIVPSNDDGFFHLRADDGTL